jgi:hypothetical protein
VDKPRIFEREDFYKAAWLGLLRIQVELAGIDSAFSIESSIHFT